MTENAGSGNESSIHNDAEGTPAFHHCSIFLHVSDIITSLLWILMKIELSGAWSCHDDVIHPEHGFAFVQLLFCRYIVYLLCIQFYWALFSFSSAYRQKICNAAFNSIEYFSLLNLFLHVKIPPSGLLRHRAPPGYNIYNGQTRHYPHSPMLW